MNKYFSKALFYDDITKNSVPSFSVLYGVMMIPILNAISGDILSKYNSLKNGIVLLTFFMCIGAIASIYEFYNNKDRKYEFILSQPYSRDAMVLTKFISTATALIVPITVYGGISTIYLLIKVNEVPIIKFWENILIGISIALLVLAIYQFVNKIVGNVIFSIFMPFILFIELELVILWIYRMLPIVGKPILDSFLAPVLGKVSNYFLEINGYKSLILIGISLVILILSTIVNRRINYEKTSDLFISSKVEKFFWILTSIASTIVLLIAIVACIKMYGYDLDFTNIYMKIIFNIITIIGSFGIYKLIYFIKRREA